MASRSENINQQTDSIFFKLPAELRVMIYHRAVPGFHFDLACHCLNSAYRRLVREHIKRWDGLLRCCKMVRFEAENAAWEATHVSFTLVVFGPWIQEFRRQLPLLRRFACRVRNFTVDLHVSPDSRCPPTVQWHLGPYPKVVQGVASALEYGHKLRRFSIMIQSRAPPAWRSAETKFDAVLRYWTDMKVKGQVEIYEREDNYILFWKPGEPQIKQETIEEVKRAIKIEDSSCA